MFDKNPEHRNCNSSDRVYVAAINADDEPLTLDVRAIEARLGGSASVLSTGKDGLQRGTATKKPLRIPKDDGAVLIIR